MTRHRKLLDLRLAESYIPAVMLLCKCMAYVCVVPVYYYCGTMRVPVIVLVLVVLYYDHLYLNTYDNFIDSTSVALDVASAALILLVVDIEICWLCQLVSGLWCLSGCCHVVFVNHGDDANVIPLPVLHAWCAVMVVAQISFAPLTTLSPSKAQSDTLAAFVRSAVYAILVLLDIYLIRAPRQIEKDRLQILRYGHILLSRLHLVCVFAVICMVSQGIRLYGFSSHSASQPPAADNHLPQSHSIINGVFAPPRALPYTRNPSPAKTSNGDALGSAASTVANMEIMEVRTYDTHLHDLTRLHDSVA